jgi:hypothetical protein
MRRLLLLFLLTATAFSYVIEYSGSVDVYYRCGAYVTEFGICHGDCFGFFAAIENTPEKPPVRVYVGDVNAEVNYTKYQVADSYQPRRRVDGLHLLSRPSLRPLGIRQNKGTLAAREETLLF